MRNGQPATMRNGQGETMRNGKGETTRRAREAVPPWRAREKPQRRTNLKERARARRSSEYGQGEVE